MICKQDLANRKIEWQIEAAADGMRPGLIRQVFANLLANAVKYTRPREQARIEVGQARTNGETAIYVRDNGVGFNMKYVAKLFGVFQRLHRAEEFEGTGVGLATVARIVRKHGGRVWAEAELNHGATFYFTLAGQPGGGGHGEREMQKGQSYNLCFWHLTERRFFGRMNFVMARPVRIQYPGAVYHVMARGNRGQAVFGDDPDRQLFLETLGEAWEDGLAHSRLCAHGQSLSPAGRDARSQPGGGDEMAARRLHPAPQRAAPPVRASVPGPLQGGGRGWPARNHEQIKRLLAACQPTTP